MSCSEKDIDYVQKKYKQTIVTATFAAGLALTYVLFASVVWLFGIVRYLNDDLFNFCLLAIGFYVPFYCFTRLARKIIIYGLKKKGKDGIY